MIIFNETKLATALAKNQVREKDTFYYLLLFFILSFLPFYSAALYREQYTSNTYFLINFLVIVIGTYAAFVMNAKGDNKDFVKRYICLSLPIVIKMMIISICVYIAIYAFCPSFDKYELLSNVVYIVLEIALYTWLAYALAMASGYIKKKGK